MEYKSRFIGTWRLKEMSLRGNDDKPVVFPNGKNAIGQLIYTQEDIMSAQIGDPDRDQHANNDYRYPSQEELKKNYSQFISYFGSYEIFPAKRLVVHNIKMSLYPNWVGTKVKRYYEFRDGDNTLVLKATPIKSGDNLVEPVLIWTRLIL